MAHRLLYRTWGSSDIQVDPAGLAALASLSGPLRIITVAGEQGAGKSTVCTALLPRGHRNPGFDLNHLAPPNGNTHGCYFLSAPYPTGGTLVVIDCEGLGNVDVQVTNRLMALAGLLSSATVLVFYGGTSPQRILTPAATLAALSTLFLQSVDPPPTFNVVVQAMAAVSFAVSGLAVSPQVYLQAVMQPGQFDGLNNLRAVRPESAGACVQTVLAAGGGCFFE